MHFLCMFSFLALLVESLAGAIPSGAGITLQYRWTSNNSQQSIAAFASDGAALASACSNTLDTGSFSTTPILLQIDSPRSASGNISVGGTSYPLHSNPADRDSPVCLRVYNEDVVEVQCSIALKMIVRPTPDSANATDDCFTENKTPSMLDFRSSLISPNTDNSTSEPAQHLSTVPAKRSSKLVPKQCVTSHSTIKIGDGDPHQNFLHKQVSVYFSIHPYNELGEMTDIVQGES